MIDDTKAERWECEAREILVQAFDTDDRSCRLAGMVLALLHDREGLLKRISSSQGN